MKIHQEISPKHIEWIAAQQMFFVGSAPLSGEGHVNVSPKGGDSFRVLGPKQVAYLDYTGSGAETIAHLRENGRIIIMFCAFEGPPQILRLHGHGTAQQPGSATYKRLARHFPENPGSRSIIEVAITRIADSCGYSVPNYYFKGARESLDKWAAKKGVEGIAAYKDEHNQRSIDGLPAIDPNEANS